MIPPHKQTDPAKAPGVIKNDVTLGDYIKRKTEPSTKKTFDEWVDEVGVEFGIVKMTRREWWTAGEVEAARLAWNEARK